MDGFLEQSPNIIESTQARQPTYPGHDQHSYVSGNLGSLSQPGSHTPHQTAKHATLHAQTMLILLRLQSHTP